MQARAHGDVFAEKANMYIEFAENQANCTDANPGAKEPDDLDNPKNLPGRWP